MSEVYQQFLNYVNDTQGDDAAACESIEQAEEQDEQDGVLVVERAVQDGGETWPLGEVVSDQVWDSVYCTQVNSLRDHLDKSLERSTFHDILSWFLLHKFNVLLQLLTQS